MPNHLLALVMQKQKQSTWCWAAVTSTVADFYQQAHSWSQCRLANWAFGALSCCKSGSSAACDRTFLLDRSLAHVGHLDRVTNGPLAWGLTDSELGSNEPVAMRRQLAGGGSHYLLIVGSGTSHNQLLTVEDPIGEQRTGPHFVLANCIYGQWAETFRTKG